MSYNSYGLKRPRPTASPPPTTPMTSLASEFDAFPTSPAIDGEELNDQVKELAERLQKMEAWQAAVTPTDPAARAAGKAIRRSSPLTVRTSPTTTPTPGQTPGSAFRSTTPGSARSKGKAKAGTPSSTKKPNTPTSTAKSPRTPQSAASLSKMNWGVMPPTMPDFSSYSDAVPAFTMSLSDTATGDTARSGLVAKKLYSQLTSLYAHYAAIKTKYDEQQPLIEAAARKMKNAGVKGRKLKERERGMKETITNQGEQIESLQNMVAKLNEKALGNMKKLMNAWRNKSVSTTFAAWKSWCVEEKSQKLKMKRFLMKLTMGCVGKCFTNWAFVVSESKREKVLLYRFSARWKQMGLFKTFTTWKDVYKYNKHERELLAKGQKGQEEEGKEGNNTNHLDHSEEWRLLNGKGFTKGTKASKAYDLNPARMKELKHEMKLLRDENRQLRETVSRMKAAQSLMRSPSPVKGKNQKDIRSNVSAIVATQKYASAMSKEDF